MDQKKKRLIINGLVCAAKMATISISNPILQFLLQESFDFAKDALLEYPADMPRVDEIPATPEIQNIVKDVLLTTNIPIYADDLFFQDTLQLASALLHQSSVVKQISQDEEYQTEATLSTYLQSLKEWAVRYPSILCNCLDQISIGLNAQEKQIKRLYNEIEQQHEELNDHNRRLHLLEKHGVVVIPSLDTITGDCEYYCNKYTEALFLHRRLPDSKRITLKDIYTLPGATLEDKYYWSSVLANSESNRMDLDNQYSSIVDAIHDFLDYAPQSPSDELIDILFIEGKAAMGKSSLISWLCWDYLNTDKHLKHKSSSPLKAIFDKYRLITIKLRDIPRSDTNLLNINSPFLQLTSYLLNKTEQELSSVLELSDIKKIFDNTILILEGFDELCMLEGVAGEGKKQYFHNLHRELNRLDCKCKIIVTTRPEYLNVEKLNFPKAHFSISPFTKENRKLYLNKYEKFAPIPPEARESLVKGDNPSLDGIVDSPLTLYMIVARNVHISDDSNLWYIYHEIFAKEVYERDYEKEGSHAINEYRELLYRLTSEIACAVSREQHLSITVDKLLDISDIRVLLSDLCIGKSKSIQDVLEDCFGLASYFRISEKINNSGKIISAVEFYHNNIKDYFYCEYLWMHLEEIYSQIPPNSDDQVEWFISSFQELFQYSVCLKDSSEGARSRPIDFLESKIRYLKEKQVITEFIFQELHQNYFKHFFGKMLQTGFIHHYEYSGKDTLLQMMACIYASVLSIYHTIYTPYLSQHEHILIADTSHVVDISTSFIFRILFPLSNIHDLSHLSFDGIMLSYLSFGKHNFQNSSFRGCLLIGCDFDGCDLRGADFSGASLQNADFRNAILDETTVFSEQTKFGHTKISRNQKPYFAPWVDSDLFFAECDWVTYISPPNIN